MSYCVCGAAGVLVMAVKDNEGIANTFVGEFVSGQQHMVESKITS